VDHLYCVYTFINFARALFVCSGRQGGKVEWASGLGPRIPCADGTARPASRRDPVLDEQRICPSLVGESYAYEEGNAMMED
jgi:hypothetical protein